MLTLDIDNLVLELKEGVLKHVGTSNKAATVKLYDVEAVDVREFGDERVKCTFEDGEGNEVEVALSPTQAREVSQDLGSLAAESSE